MKVWLACGVSANYSGKLCVSCIRDYKIMAGESKVELQDVLPADNGDDFQLLLRYFQCFEYFT